MLANGRNPFSKETTQAFKVLRNELDTLGKRKEGLGGSTYSTKGIG